MSTVASPFTLSFWYLAMPHESLPLETLPATLYDMFATIGKALSSPPRLRILNILAQSEVSVDELAARLDQSVANTSTHLKVLRQAHLVERRQEGKRAFYSIANDNALRLWLALRDMGLEELPEVRELMRRYAEEPGLLSLLEGDDLLASIRSGEVVLLDLRSPREFEAGHLPGARSIPAGELAERIAELPTDRTLVAYCRGPFCVAAIQSVQAMRDHGLTAHRLREGVIEWRAAGRELELDA